MLCIVGLNTHLNSQKISIEPFAQNLSVPVDIAHANDDRLFVVEKNGTIRIVMPDGSVISDPFLDIDDRVNSGANERGLLGLAFHPDFQNNGLFFVNYTNGSGATTVSRFNIDNSGNGDPSSETILLEIEQPFSNHNGGCINFGPDGFLYISVGDGGSGGDPMNNSQNPLSLLGKMLRIDVDCCEPYGIPDDNPFANDDFTLDEIWATGLRNAWKFSFDRETGDMWIADVGQNRYEEIDFQAANSRGGENYGWKCWEGEFPFFDNGCDDPSNFVFPIYVYENQSNVLGCSVTGGYVYRGSEIPNLYGDYVFTDFCSGQFWTIEDNGCGGFETIIDERGASQNYSSFGEDANGELYLAGVSTGEIFRIRSSCTMTVSATQTNAACLTEELGSIDLIIEGADDVQINWSDGQVGPSISDLTPGCYCAVVSDNNSACEETICIEIRDDSVFDVETLGSVISCGEAIAAEIENPYPEFEIFWFRDGQQIPGSTGNSVVLDETGVYSIQFSNSDCSSDLIEIIDLMVVELEIPVINQSGSSSFLATSGGFELYNWFLDGVFLTSTTQPILNVSEEGVYTVTVRDASGCESAMSEGFLFGTSNTFDSSLISAFNVFPNPVIDELNFNLELKSSSDISLELFGIAGQKVFESNYPNISELDISIPMSGLNPGLYILKIDLGQGQAISSRIVKL